MHSDMIGRLYTKVGGAGGFAEIKKTDGTLITILTVPCGDTVPYNVADSVVSIANGTINVKATDPVTITHEDTNGNPVNTSLSGNVVTVLDLPCAVDSKEWVLQFIDQTDVIQVVADAENIATFTNGFGANVGSIEVSTDGVTYVPISYPFTPTVGIYYFKRSTALITATYTMIQ